MLAAWLKREMGREAEEKGRASERKAWESWLRETEERESRKSEAERSGYAFIEPRPDVPGPVQESKV